MAPSVLRLRHVLRLQVISTVVTFGCAVLYCIQSINEMILAPNCFDPLCPHAWEQIGCGSASRPSSTIVRFVSHATQANRTSRWVATHVTPAQLVFKHIPHAQD